MGALMPAETAIRTRLPVPALSSLQGRSLFVKTSQTPGVASERRLRLPLGTRASLLFCETLTREKITNSERTSFVHLSDVDLSIIFTMGCMAGITTFPQLFQHSALKNFSTLPEEPFHN